MDAATEAYKALSKARAREAIEQEGGGGAAADGASSVEGTPSKKARKDRSRGDGGGGVVATAINRVLTPSRAVQCVMKCVHARAREKLIRARWVKAPGRRENRNLKLMIQAG